MVVPSLVALLAVQLATTSAAAAPKRITGKLTNPDVTVLGLAESGESESTPAASGKFTLRPAAKAATLHLRAIDGTYAGPIVVGRKGKRRAIMGVKAGAKLGKVRVRARKGYAKASGELPEKVVDEKRFARAKKGVPIGAGNFGRVSSQRTRGGAPGDLDLDGIPDRLDIDDDGDIVLDSVDRATAARSRGTQPGNEFNIRSVLAAPVWESANANATGFVKDDIDRVLVAWGRQIFEILPGDSSELDCGGEADPNDPNGWIGGRSYCTRGGSGRVVTNAPPGPPPLPEWPPFPGPAGGQFDPDGDGFGTLADDPTGPGAAVSLAPVARTDQIGTGDMLRQRVTTGVDERIVTALLPFVFATTPALVSYSDGQGNAATVSYPVAGPNPGPNPGGGGPGTDDDPFPVKAGPGGQVVVTLNFWRPQRRPIGTETGAWTDIGGLTYSAAPALGAQASCPQGAFSEDDLNLESAGSEVPYAPGAGGLRDLAPDQPASPANTLTYTLNLTQCLRGMSWSPGEAISFNFGAVDAGATGDVSVTETVPGVTFELQP
jgi:hypothetical protein